MESFSPPSAASTTAQLATPRPLRLVIPRISVDAAVEAVGMDAGGAMEAPQRWDEVAWFSLGAAPGEAGSAVLAGHLDSTTAPAIFWSLNALEPGDQMSVTRADGLSRTFSVISSQVYAFDRAPLQKIFGATAEPLLNLVTCDGNFDWTAKNYDQRLVVYARQTP